MPAETKSTTHRITKGGKQYGPRCLDCDTFAENCELLSDPPADLAALQQTVAELNANIRVKVAPDQLGRRNWCSACGKLANGYVGIEISRNGWAPSLGLCPPCLRDLMGKLDKADNERMRLEDAEDA